MRDGLVARSVVGVFGVALSALPLGWAYGPIGIILSATGVLATGVSLSSRSSGAATLVCAAAISHVAAATEPVSAGAVIGIGALLAAFLTGYDLADTHGWRRPSRQALGARGPALLAGVAGVAGLATVSGLPRPAGWAAALLVVVGAGAAGAALYAALRVVGGVSKPKLKHRVARR